MKMSQTKIGILAVEEDALHIEKFRMGIGMLGYELGDCLYYPARLFIK